MIKSKSSNLLKRPEKNIDMMTVPIDEDPSYIARLEHSNLIGMGEFVSNQSSEVIDDDFEKIIGFYISRMVNAMQYRNVYTITLDGWRYNVNLGNHASTNDKTYIESIDSK
ncbi:hypothetical protein [Liquorilactobacillus mali]|uniref:hypothetical protein n=1 Tax=Liquorilactobacillus mali TaxID=1618 RepID=UPI002955625C|nr:hypothetical protein [Liquorilactobacillus mali]MDV7757526.1 hypothetical protein [Liquorilactobacillus mali]